MSRHQRSWVRILAGEEGYATVVAAGIIAAVASLLLAVAAVASLVVARHEAQVAADLAAVSGAWEVAKGRDACTKAEEVAVLNGAELGSCDIEGRDVEVTARLRGRSAIARAGPV
ncbi:MULTISPECIES: Rv3654c family TadE-like protein [unclassified Corynebacterium]|uniref:Rv3654c family TadE-like protein n=1 Tax=unclassified Corynebacterium TaxID=2624378 RepID=UPI0008A2BC14|nr:MULTISPECIES: Rv3654c family TadE-like protein [unclassified Corynebacterium]OFQ32926.1 TadE-like protein [Corynebacterium sp. HMSC072D12]OFS37457.1 TadE-like protein [Corynebacterium sp. HMSC069E04]OFT67157.1 TadE-like protein [Corynebacterium sp. HMSC05D03]